jgi:predicted neuraminidase
MQRSLKGASVITIIKKTIVPALIVVGGVLSLLYPAYEQPRFLVKPVLEPINDQAPQIQLGMLPNAGTPSMHSVTAVELHNGNLFAMWYGGTREGHIDVSLYSSVFDIRTGQWQPAKKVLDRYDAANDIKHYVKKIGNPVLVKHPSGVLALIYVSVSLGGWATSNINMALSYDEGQTWHESKQLKVTPFINISTLVKNDAVLYADGTIGITSYHELFGEFSEIIRVNLNGDVINKYRMSEGDFTIQPSTVVFNENEAITLMRDSSRHTQKVQIAYTEDGGFSWSDYHSLAIDNPNSAIYGFLDAKQRIWMIFNNSTRDKGVEHEARANLALAVSEDRGESWKIVHYFEQPETKEDETNRFSYPWVLQTQTGDFHLMYTMNRQVFKHHIFNHAWLESLL